MENTRPPHFATAEHGIRPISAIALFLLILVLHVMLLSLFFLGSGNTARQNIHYINIEILGRSLNTPVPQPAAEAQRPRPQAAPRPSQPATALEHAGTLRMSARAPQRERGGASSATATGSTVAPVSGGDTAGAQLAASAMPADTAIAYLSTRQPPYPEHARLNREEGRVLLRVSVDPGGAVAGLTVLQSSGHPELDQSALDSVKTWRFRPARRGNTAVAATVRIPITFHLQDEH